MRPTIEFVTQEVALDIVSEMKDISAVRNNAVEVFTGEHDRYGIMTVTLTPFDSSVLSYLSTHLSE